MTKKRTSRLSYDHQPENVLYRIQRGLIGYVSYLATCEANVVFSEYVLYEPMLRIMATAGFRVECEVRAWNVPQPARGDKKKLDFVAEDPSGRFAIEAKWTDTRAVDVGGDIQKLVGFKEEFPQQRAFLVVFGTHNSIVGKRLSLRHDAGSLKGRALTEVLEPQFAYLVATQYGCRIFEIG